MVLDRDSPRGLDWKGLADKMSFSYEVIVSLRGSRSPTLALLERWENNAGTLTECGLAHTIRIVLHYSVR